MLKHEEMLKIKIIDHSKVSYAGNIFFLAMFIDCIAWKIIFLIIDLGRILLKEKT